MPNYNEAKQPWEEWPIPPDGENPDMRRLFFDELLGDLRDYRYAKPEDVPKPDNVPAALWKDDKIRARIQNHVWRGYGRFRPGPDEITIVGGPDKLIKSNDKYHA